MMPNNDDEEMCTCEPGYYCRFCRKMDARDRQLEFDRNNHD